MLYCAPETVIRITSFGKEAVDVRIPSKRTSKGMKDTDETRNKVLGFVDGMEKAGDDALDGMKKAVKKRADFEKEMAEFFANGKDTMTVGATDEFKGHVGGAFLRVFDTTGGAKTAFASEGNKFHIAAMGTGIHGTTKRRAAAVNHFVDIFHQIGRAHV